MDTKTAVILAAGRGMRLDPLETPKPLVRVGGVPLITRTIRMLGEAGISDIVVVIKKGDTLIKKLLLDSGDGPAIRFCEENPGKREMLDSLVAAGRDLTAPFIVTVCDLVSKKNPYHAFLSAFKGGGVPSKNAIATLVSADERYYPNAGANVKVQFVKNRISEIGEQITAYQGFEMGVWHFTPESYRSFIECASRPGIRTATAAFRASKDAQPLVSVLFNGGQWYDVNTPSTLIQAELLIESPRQREKPEKRVFIQRHKPRVIRFHHRQDHPIDIVVERGILKKMREYELIPSERYYSPHYMIVDRNIAHSYGKLVFDALTATGYRIEQLIADPGEGTKSMASYLALADRMFETGLDKKSIIISVGGGVIKDVAGFLASTLYRGIGFISIPTTVLAQCDAAIAFKQGVNGATGKNLIGSYYAPMKIVVDPAVLKTLDRRYVSDGLAECLKQAFSQDRSFYRFFANYRGDIADVDFLERVVRRSIALKVSSMRRDLHEEHVSLVNQYGHEVGHAVEHLSGYAYGHGESVAIGMMVSANVAALLGIADQKIVEEQRILLEKFGLPSRVPTNIRADDIIRTLRYNKKYHGGEARFVLLKKIGAIWHDKQFYTVACDDNLLNRAIEKSYG
ncbi:MAG: iron-containing alcohol dehydrogenase [Patescibacteria group bacterium]